MINCKIYDILTSIDHGILFFIGSGKQGKSSALFSIAEMFFSDRDKYIVDPYDFDISLFPGYSRVSSLADVPPDSLIVMEDLSRIYNSRQSGNNNKIGAELSIISHRDNVVLASVQNTSSIDMEFFRSQKVILFHKRVWDIDLRFERSELKALQLHANQILDSVIADFPTEDYRSFTYCSETHEVLQLPLVPWWSYQTSHFLREAKL